jgi:hypothetical protein
VEAQLTTIPTTSPSKEMEGARSITPNSFFPDILFIQGRVEDTPVSDDEPTILGEEPPSVTHADAGTSAVTYDITTKPGERIQHNPSPRMKPPK